MPANKVFFVVVALAQFAVPLLPLFGVGLTIGDRATAQGVPPELPIGVFFSIWGFIFSGLVLTAVLNLRTPSYASEQIAAPLSLAVTGNLIWMLSAQSIANVWLDFFLLLPIGFFALLAAYRLDRTSGFDGTFRSFLHGATVGLFAGWLAVAISISVPDVVRDVLNRGVSDAVWQSLWMALIPATCLAIVFANRISRNGWFFVALGWGLLGIAVNNWARLESHALAIATIVIGGYIILRRVRFGASGSYPANA